MAPSQTASRPDLEAFDYATRAPFNFVAKELIDILGAKLVAYIAGVREARAAQQYADDSRSPRHPTTESRLRLALRVAMLISRHDSKEVAQAWFMGLNPQLNDRSPARLLREGEIDEVGPEIIAAARAFVVGG
jgi:hypothetical protein